MSLTDIGRDIVAPSSPRQRGEALQRAFNSVKDFEDVAQFYGGKRIPEDEFFINTLTRNFKIPRERVDMFAQIFTDNRSFLQQFSPLPGDGKRGANVIDRQDVVEIGGAQLDQRPREFLRTCFVMMPFGPWFDRYYKEIYVPAIAAAGFDPVRADELFHAGTVVEQIWEQVKKSKILLADLSGRNANVFYELGLAHAAGRPVVLTASSIDDVPFDLRHLRVIPYDIREPDWAAKLTKHVTDHLKNGVKEPEKSIPHPFRFDGGPLVDIASNEPIED